MTPSLKDISEEAPVWTTVFRPLEPCISSVIAEVARRTGTPERDLEKKLLLHLPGFSLSELESPQTIRAEAERLANRLRLCRLPFEGWTHRAMVERLDKASLHFGPCDPGVARAIHERFHYIGASRDGHHLGLFHAGSPEVPMALATLSPMDVRNLEALFPSEEDQRRCLVLSRLFAFPWAPRNTISFLLGRVYRRIVSETPEVDTLLTYLNPNLGFTGASYQASNWRLLLETGARYAYLNGDYLTFRAVMSLPPAKRQAVRYSQYTLQPLKLFHYDLRKGSRTQLAGAMPGPLPYLD